MSQEARAQAYRIPQIQLILTRADPLATLLDNSLAALPVAYTRRPLFEALSTSWAGFPPPDATAGTPTLVVVYAAPGADGYPPICVGRAGQWLLPVTLTGPTRLVIGPATFETVGACAACLSHNTTYGLCPDWRTEPADTAPADHDTATFFAQRVAEEVTQLIGGILPSATYPNNALYVDGTTRQSWTIAVPKAPNCPVCGTAQGYPTEILHTGIGDPAFLSF